MFLNSKPWLFWEYIGVLLALGLPNGAKDALIMQSKSSRTVVVHIGAPPKAHGYMNSWLHRGQGMANLNRRR